MGRGQGGFPDECSGELPLQPFDDYDARSFIENCSIKKARQWLIAMLEFQQVITAAAKSLHQPFRS